MAGDKDELLEEAKKRLQAAWEYDKDNRTEAITDLKFLALDQWPEEIRLQRIDAQRPCLTFDHLNQHKNQVVNDIRRAKLSIKAVGVDDKTDPQLAEVFNGLMLDIQYKSSAPHVYAAAAGDAVGCGIGHFRFNTEYCDDGVYEQEINVRKIPYALAVYWDPASVLPDRSDAKWCFVVEFVPKDAFKEAYPDARPVDVQVSRDMGHGLRWSDEDGVLVAEYWRKIPVTRTLAAFENGAVYDITDVPKQQLAALGMPTKTREAKSFKVEQSLITGADVLEGPVEWAGKHIPVVPVIGDEIQLETAVVRRGLIRGARDSQQFYNFERTAAAETVAQSPKSKWLATAKQIGTRLAEWANANISPKPYLLYEPDAQAAQLAPQRIAPPEPPTALWQGAAQTLDDMKAATGIYDASLGAKSNETSGIAIQRRQQEGDISTYHFADNLKRSLEHAGRIMIDLIPKIYDTQRVVRLMNENEEHQFEQINVVVGVDQDGKEIVLNDLSAGKFDVRVDIGPSYTTQRLEAADQMIEYFKADPKALDFARDIYVRNMDWPGSDELAERLKHTIPPQVLGEDAPPPPPPDPQAQMVNQLQVRGAEADIRKKEADAAKSDAEAHGKEMDNAERAHQIAVHGVAPPQHAMPPPMPGEQQPPQ